MARQFARKFERTKRGNVWFSANIGTSGTLVPAGTPILLATLNAAALALRPFTIIRTRLAVMWRTDQVTAVEDPYGALGMQVVSDSAAAAGIASVPTPITETNADFFVYQSLVSSILFGSTVAFTSPAGTVYNVDSKAMRKVGTDEDVAFTAENSSALDGGAIVVTGRMLVKLL